MKPEDWPVTPLEDGTLPPHHAHCLGCGPENPAGMGLKLRIDGELVPLKVNPLSPVETKQLCYSILTDAQKHKFEEDNELDLSFGVKGLSRAKS